MSNQTAASEQRLLPPHRWWVALTLAAIAGGVDGIGYLLLAHIFTSHMSGNTVAMTMYVASRKWSEAWRHIAPIVIFFLGIVA
ncbi:MAG TPA: YoaK family protein, partial [Candidatus Baltobacteraceae bacterium]|nr:YoaK family protein [Candidatus Baltobacteraceae bacterium]